LLPFDYLYTTFIFFSVFHAPLSLESQQPYQLLDKVDASHTVLLLLHPPPPTQDFSHFQNHQFPRFSLVKNVKKNALKRERKASGKSLI
jgi:hypothetical protein